MTDKKPPTLLNRLENVEGAVAEGSAKIDSMFGQLRTVSATTFETISAVIEALKEKLGPDFADLVSQKYKESDLKKLTDRANAEKAQLEASVAAGTHKAADVISPTSLLVARLWRNNEIVPPGRMLLDVEQGFVSEDIKAKFIGQGPGFLFETPDGEKLEVLEVYDMATKAAAPMGTPENVALSNATASTGLEAPSVVNS